MRFLSSRSVASSGDEFVMVWFIRSVCYWILAVDGCEYIGAVCQYFQMCQKYQ